MTRRRYLTFSLRTLFVLLTALAVWLGVVVNRAREQREAVKAIEALGGILFYDWQLGRPRGINYLLPRPRQAEPPGPEWLRKLIGDHYFQNVDVVYFYPPTHKVEQDIVKSARSVQGIRNVRKIFLYGCTENTRNEIKAALPACEVRCISH